MKLTYRQMLDFLNAGLLQPGSDQPIPLLNHVVGTDGLPSEVAVRLRTIRDEMQKHLGVFAEQRDAILAKYKVRLNEEQQTVEPTDDIADADEEMKTEATDRIAKANAELASLLKVQVEGIRTLRASVLSAATGPAYQLLVTGGVLDWLWPVVTDDLPK